jgi:hypothetical protein
VALLCRAAEAPEPAAVCAPELPVVPEGDFLGRMVLASVHDTEIKAIRLNRVSLPQNANLDLPFSEAEPQSMSLDFLTNEEEFLLRF